MKTITPAVPKPIVMKRFYAPKNLVKRFVAKRTRLSALVFGAILAIYMISKASSYVKLYPTEAARQKVAETLGANIGVEAILGIAHHLETVGGYAVWNFLCLLAAAGAIWALLIATKTFRGEEDTGRWELLLAGQTSARRAAANALIGLGSSLLIIFCFLALSALGISRLHGADLSASACLFFALALMAGAAEFMAVGALASQLMPIRSRAAGLSAIVFGVFYMIRLTADTTNAHWLLNVSPLGWIEKLQPTYNSQPVWLIPIAGFILILCWLTVSLAGRRDLGDATFADKDTDKPHTKLLGSPLPAAFRLNRSTILGWLGATGLITLFYGLMTKGAAKAFGTSASFEKALKRVADVSRPNTAIEFMGIIFFMTMILVMFYAASSIGRIRQDEAVGYLDNFLVRPVSRLRWLGDRAFLAVSVVICAGLLSGLAAWAGEAAQHNGVAFHSLILAGLNAMAPVILVLGAGIFALGVRPRLTSVIAYGVVVWSLLIDMLASGLNLNHWLLDTSVLHQVVLAPAVSPKWSVDLIILIISIGLGLIGAVAFNRRDLETE